MSISILNQGNSIGISSTNSSGIVTTFVFDTAGLGNIGIGTTVFTGTANQKLQVGGGAYISGSVGIGTTLTGSTKLITVGTAVITGITTIGVPGITGTVLNPTVDQYSVSIGLNGSSFSAASFSVGIGNSALSQGGAQSVAVGAQALQSSIGNNNTAIGAFSMQTNSTGAQNSAIGAYSLYNNFNGIYNNTFGYQAGFGITIGNYNNAFGYNALYNASGNSNTAIGDAAGSSQTSGDYNVIIGPQQNVPILTGSNQLTIGAGNTAWIYGNNAYNIGIGTTNPTSTLAVGGTITELYSGTYWNMVSQYDVGIGASQIPLNQYLGQLAFADQYSPYGLRRDGGGSDDVVVNSSGFVGIGTTNPLGTLQVGSATTQAFVVNSVGQLVVGATSATNDSPIIIKSVGAAATPAPQILISPTTGTNQSVIQFASGGSGGFFIGRSNSSGNVTNTNGVTAFSGLNSVSYADFIGNSGTLPLLFLTNSTEAMRINSSQQVGIGTTNPLGTLQVGAGTSTFIVTGIGSVGIGTTTPTDRLTLHNASGPAGMSALASGNAYLVLDSGRGGTVGNQISFIDFKLNSTLYGNLAVNEGTSGTPFEINSAVSNNVSLVGGGGNVGIASGIPAQLFQVGAGSTQSMVVTGVGSVGIGTTNPQYALQVRGDLQVSGTLRNSSFVAFSVAFGI
jgi:hypothetical protein